MGFEILYATMLITASALANRNHAVKAKHFLLLTCLSWRHWQDVSRSLTHFLRCVCVCLCVDTLNSTVYSPHWYILLPFGSYRVFLFTCNLSLSIASSSPFLFLCWVLLVWFWPDAFAPSPGDGPSEGVAPAAAADACAGSGGCSSIHKIHPAFYLCVPVYLWMDMKGLCVWVRAWMETWNPATAMVSNLCVWKRECMQFCSHCLSY